MAIALWSATRSITSRARSLNSVIVNDSTGSRLSSRRVRPIDCSMIKMWSDYKSFRIKSTKHIKFLYDHGGQSWVIDGHCIYGGLVGVPVRTPILNAGN